MDSTIILMLVIGYLLGSIPSGIWIGKIFYNKDIRQFGSGNMGTTNTFRVLGKKAGAIVLIVDMLKGTLAACQPYLFGVHINVLIIGCAAVIGHVFPIFAKFKGGKAVATSAGILLAYSPGFFIVAWVIFLTTLYLSSMVSIASMVGMTLITILSLFFHDPILTIIAIILTIFVFYRHKGNLSRIKNGNENLVPFGLVYKRKNNK
ncbi:glycerol-3-phosphate 1-O-acyltransferase PlsY [Liquorilactobacillus hordei]|uniref:Glycerol-3-phosphate acyltransferase n=3 Tax=Liquorilactobacillus hordei TaxID=468911 RepID=A0A3S6QU32_9LACO|nr:glycerol-3-phosphate 1-O-acyltransferase PlsY [Liquorilactobacillus hordei]AUJ29827.1 acyl-phosphate glycerol 3-phosphate acyltransferase [Liquorilactobacillus hordei]MBZ2404922.1 acyl-phosphate glycerol 3-phosphate acyltransferase [Liquorilactobacillus hordei]